MSHADVIAIVGATATGKSDLALDMADALGGPERAEIVNADAMQLYRGMDIGTAKVPESERRGIAHHQLDVLEVHQDASVAEYQRIARADIEAIRQRGRVAIVVGGSGLYMRALLDEIEFPGTDPQVRARLELRAEHVGPGVLHAQLAALDPEAARRILPGNTRRIVRALEVIELTGRPFTATLPQYTPHLHAVYVGLSAERGTLDDRIRRRAERMMADGLVAEVDELIGRGLLQGRTAVRAVGYAQALNVVNAQMSVPECVEAISVATRQLARRQYKWFVRDPRVRWVDATDPEPGHILERAWHEIGRGSDGAPTPS